MIGNSHREIRDMETESLCRCTLCLCVCVCVSGRACEAVSVHVPVLVQLLQAFLLLRLGAHLQVAARSKRPSFLSVKMEGRKEAGRWVCVWGGGGAGGESSLSLRGGPRGPESLLSP